MQNIQVKNEILIKISRVLSRLFGNIVKTLSYPFHWMFPKKRFVIPTFSPAKIKNKNVAKIPRIIWQTNYSNLVTLPVYCNYLFNRLLSLDYDYYYVSTEEREIFIKENSDQASFDAYSRLTDGAAQADFWRLFVLYKKGGIYMDIDAHLIWNLSSIVKDNYNEVLITRRNKYTNFFLASKSNNEFLKDTLDIIIDNIEQRRVDGGVFHLTGPTTLNTALEGKQVNTRLDRLTCIQGTFTNEYFQYIDKKLGKWNHKKNEDLLK
ncbi:glycosyltransferase [Pasteurella skyensis]|uniref:Glycosyltransferase n=1 Tax=Phocoenobacter skyensis TaxID=97481 RepID=A0AAJ6NBH9_9PAST|nr:glycosyltransferase [Pasteurella skyensis]MDP8163454.1 glycosyltransferase [Pasteurella skyensis]MDP8173767.1 glycosyltransferase [Pasteurella skyensis]MDP8179925.1 glycosyltransferase [Pasteurella skyensis]MDP8184031.1 glycosyltransferase [Pasteurella skyensis]MDP8190233.1 glycosyltransferase [Pasteurella skyensis]